MIDLYSWPTPNGHKVHIMLEECALSYRVHPVDIGKGEQFDQSFLTISPNNKIPAITDSIGIDGKPVRMFESGAILLYLAGKTGRFLGNSDSERYECLQWLMFQMGGIGPMLGQCHHFRRYAPEKIQYAIDRYTNEAKRLYGVLDKQLSGHAYVAGSQYTIADMAIWPWLRNWKGQGVNLAEYPHLERWFNELGERPAVQRGITVLAEHHRPLLDDKAREVLFGNSQYQKR